MTFNTHKKGKVSEKKQDVSVERGTSAKLLTQLLFTCGPLIMGDSLLNPATATHFCPLPSYKQNLLPLFHQMLSQVFGNENLFK